MSATEQWFVGVDFIRDQSIGIEVEYLSKFGAQVEFGTVN